MPLVLPHNLQIKVIQPKFQFSQLIHFSWLNSLLACALRAKANPSCIFTQCSATTSNRTGYKFLAIFLVVVLVFTVTSSISFSIRIYNFKPWTAKQAWLGCMCKTDFGKVMAMVACCALYLSLATSPFLISATVTLKQFLNASLNSIPSSFRCPCFWIIVLPRELNRHAKTLGFPYKICSEVKKAD